MKKIIITSIIWLVISLIMFDWGFTVGGYEGYETQASYTRFEFPVNGGFKIIDDLPKALHQFTPFPDNLFYAIENFNFVEL